MKNYTSNGILFTEEITSINGASFVLFPEKHHSKEDIQQAKAQIRHERDVVSMTLASEDDRDYLFKGDYFLVPACRPLRWYQIEQNEKLIRSERRKGTTPEDFVIRYVLPFVDRVEAENRAKYGNQLD